MFADPVARPRIVRHRFRPTSRRVLTLLESLAEVEEFNEHALPPAYAAAHALSAVRRTAPWFQAERVVIAVRGLAHAGLPARVAGSVTRLQDGHARARLRISQRTGRALDIDAVGSVAIPPGTGQAHPMPGKLAAFGRALRLTSKDYGAHVNWPAEYVVALGAAGVEAESDSVSLARLLRLQVELVNQAPIERALHLHIDGVRPVSGDMARVRFRIVSGWERLVARGDALILSGLARSSALAIPFKLVA